MRSIERAASALSVLLAVSDAAPVHASDAASSNKAAHAETITIDGAVVHPQALTLADLKRDDATTEAVSQRAGKGRLAGSFTGVALWTLLQRAVIKVSSARNELMRHTILVTGSDGYATVLSVAEIDPEFGGERAIIAYAKDGQPLSERRGFARLIFPGEQSAGRAIGGVATITVR